MQLQYTLQWVCIYGTYFIWKGVEFTMILIAFSVAAELRSAPFRDSMYVRLLVSTISRSHYASGHNSLCSYFAVLLVIA